MKKLIYSVLAFLVCHVAMSQATFTNTGNWETPGNWSGNNIGDLISENVTISNNRSALINNGSTYTIGNLDFGNSSALTINSTGVLNVGNSGNPRDVTANNSATLTVTGTMIIWGDLIVNNNLVLNVSGILIVKGNVQMNNGASISVTGSVDIEGDFIGGNNTNVSISGGGSVNVDGDVSLGNNSNLTGPPGSFTVGGGCTQGGGSSFCNSSTLPVELLFFNAIATTNQIKLKWATASELNSDFFEVQRSFNGLDYEVIAHVNGGGTSQIRIDYEVVDEKPRLGRTYYRLRQVDVDGKEATYPATFAEFTGEKNFSVYPSLLRKGNELTLELNFEPQVPAEVVIHDLSGRFVDRFLLSGGKGSVSNINFGAGLYLVRISSPEFNGSSKFVVVD
ncbi:MAG: T9SS type A sorting domain-containing protein [Cyclobacteriaceae bacterium]|nr:T9SS type A sorting domain-containing protein [Cyclobacteriaceae bacterium]